MKKVSFMGQRVPLSTLLGTVFPVRTPFSWVLPGALFHEPLNNDSFNATVDLFQKSLEELRKHLRTHPLSEESRRILQARIQENDAAFFFIMNKSNQAAANGIGGTEQNAIRRSFGAALNDLCFEKQVLIGILQ